MRLWIAFLPKQRRLSGGEKKDQARLVWTAVRSLIFKIRIVKLANVRTECATH